MAKPLTSKVIFDGRACCSQYMGGGEIYFFSFFNSFFLLLIIFLCLSFSYSALSICRNERVKNRRKKGKKLNASDWSLYSQLLYIVNIHVFVFYLTSLYTPKTHTQTQTWFISFISFSFSFSLYILIYQRDSEKNIALDKDRSHLHGRVFTTFVPPSFR